MSGVLSPSGGGSGSQENPAAALRRAQLILERQAIEMQHAELMRTYNGPLPFGPVFMPVERTVQETEVAAGNCGVISRFDATPSELGLLCREGPHGLVIIRANLLEAREAVRQSVLTVLHERHESFRSVTAAGWRVSVTELFDVDDVSRLFD